MEREKKIEEIEIEENNKEKKQENFGNKFAKNVLMLIVAQILVKVLGLIYRVVIVNVKGFRKCRKPDTMHQVTKYMHLCLHYQVLVYHLLYQN